MGYYAKTCAAVADRPLKNRARDFFETSASRAGFSVSNPFETASQTTVIFTIIVSGRSVWPNRDLIAERGGLNVYGFVGNNLADHFDELGLVACSWAVGLCTRNVGNANIPSTVTIGGITFTIPQWIKDAVNAAIPDHHNVKIESYRMLNCVVGSIIEESLVRGFFADSFMDSLTYYGVSLIPFSGVNGWVPGNVAGDSNPGTCSIQCVSKDRFDLVKQRITTAPNQNYHLTQFNCQHWAAQQLQ